MKQDKNGAAASGSMHFSMRELTISAMLVALGIVLSFVRIPLSQVTEITLTGLPMALGGHLFGPVTGFVIGALVDVGGCLLAPKGPYFPGFTLSYGLVGAIYGLFLYSGSNLLRKEVKGLAGRVALAHFLKTLLISLLLNCFWLSIFYGMPFNAVFLMSLPKELINFPIETFLIYSMIRIAARLRHSI